MLSYFLLSYYIPYHYLLFLPFPAVESSVYPVFLSTPFYLLNHPSDPLLRLSHTVSSFRLYKGSWSIVLFFSGSLMKE